MIPIPATPEAYQLLQRGAIALAQVERNGMRIDMDLLDRTEKKVDKQLEDLGKELRGRKFFKKWIEKYEGKANLGSRDQLVDILHNVYEYPVEYRTKTGKPSSDAEALEKIDHPFVKDYVYWDRLNRLKGNFLKNIRREIVGDKIHPVINLHTASSYRSSMDSPNGQNFPARDGESAKTIRSLFIARPHHKLVEIDFKQIEVGVSCGYNKDQNLIAYCNDTSKDMHRDMAAIIFMCRKDQVSSKMRYFAKNMFVFPEFYGSFYKQCVPQLYFALYKYQSKLEGTDISVLEHLKKQGIRYRGNCKFDEEPKSNTFEKHVMEVEHHFWNKRFRDYKQWKIDWWNDYQECGSIQYLTGFTVNAPLSKNQCTNIPIQGSAFHCDLETLCELQDELKTRKMRSLIVSEIHDSIIGDVHKNEVEDYLKIAKKKIDGLHKKWKWINVNLRAEAGICEPTWFDKKEVTL